MNGGRGGTDGMNNEPGNGGAKSKRKKKVHFISAFIWKINSNTKTFLNNLSIIMMLKVSFYIIKWEDFTLK